MYILLKYRHQEYVWVQGVSFFFYLYHVHVFEKNINIDTIVQKQLYLPVSWLHMRVILLFIANFSLLS